MKTSAWIRPRSSSAEASVAPFRRMRFGSSTESLTSGSRPTPPRSPATRATASVAPRRTSCASCLVRNEKPCVATWTDSRRFVLPAPFGPGDEDEARLERELEASVRADVPERDLRDDQRATTVSIRRA